MRSASRSSIVVAVLGLALALPGAGLSAATGASAPAAAQDTLRTRSVAAGGDAGDELTLADVLSRAVEGNRELSEARWSLRAAEARVSEAWGAVLPRIDLSGTYTRNLSPPVAFLPAALFDPQGDTDRVVPVRFGADNAWDAAVSLEQPLFEARALVGIGAARRYRELGEEQERATRTRVSAEVRQLYFDLLLAAEETALVDRSVARVEQALAQARALAAEGLGSDYDVLRLEVERAALEPELAGVQGRRDSVARELRVALGMDPEGGIRPVGALAHMDLTDESANLPENLAILTSFRVVPPAEGDTSAVRELVERVRDDAPSVRGARAEAALREADLRAEQAAWLPSVSLFGSYRVQAQQDGSPEFFGTGPLRGYERWVGVRLSLPVFTGGQRVARIRQRRADLEAVELRADRTGDEAVAGLLDLVAAADRALDQARAQNLARSRARQGYDMARAQFDEGLLSRLELIDAEIALRESERRYASAVHAYLTARAQIDALVGGNPI